jgi:hypothetical protein
MKFLPALLTLAFIPLFATLTIADETTSRMKSQPSLKKESDEKEWTIELGTGMMWSDVRTDLLGYTLVPVELTASTAVDGISLDNFLGGCARGYTEFFFRGQGMAVLHGIESRFTGINLGPRYNFCQPGWVVDPFVEGHVGFSFNDSQGAFVKGGQQGQGQDFSFQFGISLGAKYNITDDWFLRFAAVYTHFSNAGLSEPDRKNRALDAAGPIVSVGYSF